MSQMIDFKAEIAKIIAEAINSKEFSRGNVEELLEIPPDKELGDFAFPCFKLATVLKKKPHEIAKELLEKIEKPVFVGKIIVSGAYLNFFVKEENLASEVIEKILEEKVNYGKGNKKGNIAVEFCHANTHKAFHIGHVRNISLGESISRMLEFLSYRVFRLNYQGDVGPHVSKCIREYLNNYKDKEPEKGKGDWLGKVYAEGAKKVEGKAELEQEMRNFTKRLFEGDKELKKVWEKTRQWSLEYFEEIYKDFGVSFDRLYFESEMEKRGQEIAKELLKKGLAEKDEGAILMDLEKYNLGKFIILKSDEMPLYSTKDLALAEKKFKEYDVEKSLHIVGAEQEFYFRQLIKALELIGFSQAKKTAHVVYGLVTLKEGKMSSRLGNVISYRELFDKMYKKSEEEVKKRHEDWEKKKIEETARKIALAAIKFGMLNRDNRKKIEFDWETALSMEGETGPYLQYSFARASSILRKGSCERADYSLLVEPLEKELIVMLNNFPEVVEHASGNCSAMELCQYLIKLCEVFNSFYHKLNVLKAEEGLKKARLALVEAFKITLGNGLFLLGIDGLEEM